VEDHRGRGGTAPRQSRGEEAAARLVAMAEAAQPGDRIGGKEQLRATCAVSVGTFNEAVRIAQSRGVVTVRPGPGGGIFAAAQSPMVRLGNFVLALDDEQTSVAEATRLCDALDPLLVEDALWHASPADIAEMREILAEMGAAVQQEDAHASIRANWSLHARIAAVSPHVMLRTLYVNLLDLIQTHTLDVLPSGSQPLPEFIAGRHALHVALVDAVEARDRDLALRLIAEHKISEPSSEPRDA
jgi:DNA-binding FadR family transcriptional regulator